MQDLADGPSWPCRRTRQRVLIAGPGLGPQMCSWTATATDMGETEFFELLHEMSKTITVAWQP